MWYTAWVCQGPLQNHTQRKSGRGHRLGKLSYIWGSPLIFLQRLRCPLSVSWASCICLFYGALHALLLSEYRAFSQFACRCSFRCRDRVVINDPPSAIEAGITYESSNSSVPYLHLVFILQAKISDAPFTNTYAHVRVPFTKYQYATQRATMVDFCRLIYQPCSAGSGCRRIRKATLRRHLQNVCPLDAQAPNAYSADRKLTASPSPIMRDAVGGGHMASS